ncbi:MAG: dTDP-4-dehydrorhamnose reductase [Flavobacteriaceae bacterium]
MPSYLVTGSNGQLGQCFKNVEKEFPGHQLIFKSKYDFDITNLDDFNRIFRQRQFDGIINCAAYTNVEKAEHEKDKANEINGRGVQNLVEFTEKNQLSLIHFSTDYVFDGENKNPIKEDEDPKPLNHYARSKLIGEEAIINSSSMKVFFRISWLFSPYGNNFVKKILKLSSANKKIQVINDQFGKPTYGIDLARSILENISHPDFFSFNCYHYANKESTNWHSFAQKIIEFSNEKCHLIPCSIENFSQSVKRPEFSILDTKRIENHLSLNLTDWQNALKRCLKRIKHCE